MLKEISMVNKISGLNVLILLLIAPLASINAQRMGHRASRGGSRSMSSRPSTQRSAPSRSTAPRQSTQRSSTPRPSTSNTPSRSINGGHTRTNDRSYNRTPSTQQRDVAPRQRTSDRSGGANAARPNTSNERNRTSDIKNNSGNRTNIDNSRRNINIDNSRNVNINRGNTYVRVGVRPYVRPPYRYGGFGYYCHRAYFYHPYRPFYWGPVWHPWGFFVAAMATTAIIISIENQQYHYDQGVYYVSSSGGYTVVQAPVGATVETIPKEAEVVEVNETTNNYYYGGAYYEKSDEGYTVVPATAGTIVPHLPEGGEEVKVGDQTYVKFGETYYQPIQLDGEDMYEIVEVREEGS